MGRKVHRKVSHKGMPLVRVKPKDLAAAGVERTPPVVGVRDGRPLLEDQRVLEVPNVIWCTGFGPDFSWIELPVFDESRTEPLHERGVVTREPGVFFVGLFFLFAASSSLLRGVSRDADHVVEAIAARNSPSVPA